jgi:hypothetical protein
MRKEPNYSMSGVRLTWKTPDIVLRAGLEGTGLNKDHPLSRPNQHMGWSSFRADSAMLDERAVIQFGDGLAKLLLGVHHDGAIPRNGFLDRLARYQQESDARLGPVLSV